MELRLLKQIRLILRKFEQGDNNDMLIYWFGDPEIQFLYFEPTYTTHKQVKKLLDEYMLLYKNDDYYRWVIIEKDFIFV